MSLPLRSWALPVVLGFLVGLAVHLGMVLLEDPPPPTIVQYPEIPFPGDTIRIAAEQVGDGICFLWITEGSDAFGNLVAGSATTDSDCSSGVEFTIPIDLRVKQEFFAHFAFVDDDSLPESTPVRYWGYRSHQIQIDRTPEATIVIYPQGSWPPDPGPPMGRSWRTNALFASIVLLAYLVIVTTAAYRFSNHTNDRLPETPEPRGSVRPRAFPTRDWRKQLWSKLVLLMKTVIAVVGFLASLGTILSFLQSL